jgi:acetyl esterase/lipase
LSSLFLAVAFLLAAFLFFRPWWQFLAARPTWSGVMDKVFGAVEPPPLSSRSSLEREIVFKEMSPAPLRIRLFLPVEEGPWPWVVAVHPGGWDSGSTDDFRWMHRRLARRGWAVAVPEYRLAPDHPWPAQREDIEDAVRFLKQNAERLHLDSSRWALLGRSAGGQIAESVAFASQDPSLKGLIACYAPSDLLYAYEHGREDDVIRTRPLLRRLIGGSPEEMRGAYIKASPINAVSSHAPPTLLLHGPRDTVTWSLHSRRLAERLAEVRVPVVLIEPPWAAHGFDYFPAGPGGRLAAWAMERFLSAVFAKGTSR